MDGLRQLEYRGYDSAGIAVLDAQGAIHVRREKGKLGNLHRLLAEEPVSGSVAIVRSTPAFFLSTATIFSRQRADPVILTFVRSWPLFEINSLIFQARTS